MSVLRQWVRSLFCRHDWATWTELYGDERFYTHARWVAHCRRCGAWRRR
jgi:hypothetical protein